MTARDPSLPTVQDQTEWGPLLLFTGFPWGLYLVGYPDAAILAAITFVGAAYLGRNA